MADKIALVIGAGVAGSSIAIRFREIGYNVSVNERK